MNKLSLRKKIALSIGMIVFVIFGIPFVATLISQARYELTKPPPLLRETDDTTLIHVVIGNEKFWIPANYFLDGYTKRDKIEQTVWIRAHWPDMTGATKGTIERRKKLPGHLNEITILIRYFPTNTNPPAGKLSYYNTMLKRTYNKFKEPQEFHGLIYRENIAEKEGEHVRDLFIDNLKQPETIISCIRIKKLKEWERHYPICNQYFNYKGLSFTVSYSREYLPQWKAIQEKVKYLIDQFEKKATQTPSSAAGE